MKTDATQPVSIDAYIAGFPAPVRSVLRQVRATIRKAVPSAEETISYRIPTYKLHGRPVIYFAGWKEHYSLYPSGSRIVATFAKELAPYEVEKGTIRFPLTARVPVKLIAGIAKLRAKEVADRKAKSAATRKRK